MSTAMDTATIEVPRKELDAMRLRMQSLQSTNEQLQQQLDWFKRQLFGPKSEKRPEPDADQTALFERAQGDAAVGKVPTTKVPAHERRRR